ncbi:MAG: polyphosphate kinase 1 [Clostridia bacterium]|nr:polyphosphate kinase 1 [Clostridia bacterium]
MADKESKNRKTEEVQLMENRELSWLKFNTRVLEEAEDSRVPLCERLSFMSIYQTNLDEFFMVRVGSLVDQDRASPKNRDNKTGMTAKEQIDAILKEVSDLGKRKNACYNQLMELVAEQGIHIVDFRKIGRQDSEKLERVFDSQIAPLISPIIVEPRQPFPFLKGKDIYAVVELERKNGRDRLGIVPCIAGVFPRLIEVGSAVKRYVLVEELILHFIYKVFPGYYIKSKSLARVTRNADIDADALYDEEHDYREFMAELMKRRKRLAPVRIELSRQLNNELIERLCKELNVKKKYVFKSDTPLDLSFVFKIQDELRQRSELFYPRRVPQRSAMFEPGRSILAQIREGDKLLSYPFESMNPFLDMLQEAGEDDDVVSIKMTLYRVAKHSKIVEALCDAAENGKEVLVLVELKARFDEENNIEWSRQLEEAGCNVIYGLDGYKVHSKLCLITRREKGETAYYTQIGTGNYNEKTARIYTDYCLITADPRIGEDANEVFNRLSMGETVEDGRNLLVAPHCLQNRLLQMMDEEIQKAKNGEEAYIGFKINSLTDRTLMEKMVEASQAGVKIDLIVRGICCLKPGIAGYTEHIQVISIVGRFLEHSRIYIFGKGETSRIYLASADLMTRNTLKRVEVAVPVYDAAIRNQILTNFNLMLSDNVQARVMDENGKYVRRMPGETAISSQEIFYQQAYDRAAERAAQRANAQQKQTGDE